MTISELVSGFLPLIDNNEIQSEAEVRSKFIVPLLEIMGYPMELRAEEYPVYGSEGSNLLPTKKADFIQFTDSDFSSHRSKAADDLNWVYAHSLLVFEAKKPSETISTKHQPQFYAAWTRAVAYLISNGKTIEGYVLNPNFTDSLIISCEISELPSQFDKLSILNYDNLREKKTEAEALNETFHQDPFSKYIESMALRCSQELYCNVERKIVDNPIYALKIDANGKEYEVSSLVQEYAAVITSEPGGGKSTLMWRIMSDILQQYHNDRAIIPVLLEGKYYGEEFVSLKDGIYKELHRFCSIATPELIESLIKDSRILLLFDGFDEIRDSAHHSKELLSHELSQLRASNPDFRILITSREQNYHGELSSSFHHYQLAKLSDDSIRELIRILSNDEVTINLWNLPKDLKELLRTPLFLTMFVSSLVQNPTQIIPKNKIKLFDNYIKNRFDGLKCTTYQKVKIKEILSNYARVLVDDGESNETFVKIVDSVVNQDSEKYFSWIWNSGIINEGHNGIKFFHKAFAEYFYAVWLSGLATEKILEWVNAHTNDENYFEIICYLTGVISKQCVQDSVLDLIESNNLSLLIQAIKARKVFEPELDSIDEEYGKQFVSKLFSSYQSIISNHFSNIAYIFDGYRNNGNCSLNANIDFSSSTINLCFFEGNSTSPVQITWNGNSGMVMRTANGDEISFGSAVMAFGNIHHRQFNLKVMGLGYDSAREIAIHIIKDQLIKAIDKKRFLDRLIPALICEDIESELKNVRMKITALPRDERINVSLHTVELSQLSNLLYQSSELTRNKALSELGDICSLLEQDKVDPKGLLDVPPDLVPADRKNVHYVDEYYSDYQLARKIERAYVLRNRIMQNIMEDIIPALSVPSFSPTSIIGFIYRDTTARQSGQFPESSFDYVTVRCSKAAEPYILIQSTDRRINTMATDLPIEVTSILTSLGKTKKDILHYGSTSIFKFLESDLIHKVVYDDLKTRVKTVLGD